MTAQRIAMRSGFDTMKLERRSSVSTRSNLQNPGLGPMSAGGGLSASRADT